MHAVLAGIFRMPLDGVGNFILFERCAEVHAAQVGNVTDNIGRTAIEIRAGAMIRTHKIFAVFKYFTQCVEACLLTARRGSGEHAARNDCRKQVLGLRQETDFYS